MDKNNINILIVESSQIICEGLSNILLNSNSFFSIYQIDDLLEIDKILSRHKIDFCIINPKQVVNRIKLFNSLKSDNQQIVWIGLYHNFFENEIISLFNLSYSISENPLVILEEIKKIINSNTDESLSNYHLSSREIDVLKELVKGYSNKEIADRLNISIHTVVSHRKNISQKTGIKSQAGLTIYAISKKIIQLN